MDAVAKTSKGSATDKLAFNASRAELGVSGFEDIFRVQAFRGHDHDLSTEYRFVIEASADQPVNIEKLPGRDAVISIRRQGNTRKLHGFVRRISHNDSGVNEHDYILTISSPMESLSLSRHNRVFLSKTLKEVVTEILLTSGFTVNNFRFNLGGDYPAIEYLVQYDEADYAFILRLISKYGIFYYYTETENGYQVIFADRSDKLVCHPTLKELPYVKQSAQSRLDETVWSIRRELNFRTAEHVFSDYNYRTPETTLKSETAKRQEIPASGETYWYGSHFKNNEEGKLLADSMQASEDWQREVYLAETDSPAIQPGYKIRIRNHDISAYNTDYIVIKVEHSFDQKVGNDYRDSACTRHYQNRVLMIRATSVYKPIIHRYAQSVPGVFTAKIESTGGQYAYLDDQGLYHVRMPYDQSDQCVGQASHPLRMASAYTGSNYGLHWPLHHGTEVAISCVNGDIDRPVILGALHNPSSPSPVTSVNPTQNILRTWGQNELLMDDAKDQERVSLFTKSKANILDLSAEKDRHKISLVTEKGDMRLQAAKTILIESGDTTTQEAGNNHEVYVENAQRLLTRSKDIEVQAATDIRYNAGRDILLAAEQQDIIQRAEKNYIVEVDESYSTEVRNRHMTVSVNNGNLDIKAAKNITVQGDGGGLIHIGQAGGSIEISTGGNLAINAPTVDINAKSINLKGQSISNN